MAEQLICNQQVVGSTPITSSIYGSVPEWPKGADCKSVVCDFGGPNPPAPTKKFDLFRQVEFFYPLRSNGISSTHDSAAYIISPLGLYLITHQRVYRFAMMIYTASP